MFENISLDSTRYISVNTIDFTEDVLHYPVEFLNIIAVPGVPFQKIQLTIGVSNKLLYNLNLPKQPGAGVSNMLHSN